MAPLSEFLKTFIYLVHLISNFILDTILGWYWGSFKCCPPPFDDAEIAIVTKSAVELAQLIRERELSSYNVVKAYIERIKTINPVLNAVVDGPFEQDALDAAQSVDNQLKITDKSIETLLKETPFLGVPFTTKDSTAVAGKLHTLGMYTRRNVVALEDADVVRLMKNAGAIIIATSNVPEVNKWIETRNMLCGQTNNPYDLRRSAGGSSGGEASLISSCCTAFGLGTDIGGSIRIPAYNCGIFGHKPTLKMVNTRGCTFRTGDEENTMVVAGPMSRYAKDLMPILKVIVGPENCKKFNLDKPVDLKKLRYFYIPQLHMTKCNPISDEAQDTMEKIRRYFHRLIGEPVQFAKLPHTDKTSKMWRYWMTQEPANFNDLLGNGKKLNPIKELILKLIGGSNFSMAAIYSLIDGILPKENEQEIRKATNECKQAIKELLGDDGVLFFHSSPRPTPFHYYPLIKFLDFSYFSLFNVLQLPVTQVPMGLYESGLPLGIQVIANDGNDHLCLAVAEELEKAFGGWRPPYAKYAD